MTSWKLFFALMVTASLMLGGALVFVVSADYDYHYELNHKSDHLEVREDKSSIGYGSPLAAKRHDMLHYEEMSPTNQRKFDRAISDGEQVFEHQSQVPVGIVEQDGTYYYFDIWRDFDWMDYHTFLPAAMAVFGLLASIKVVHLDITGRSIAQRI